MQTGGRAFEGTRRSGRDYRIKFILGGVVGAGWLGRVLSVFVAFAVLMGLVGLPSASAAGVLTAPVPTISGAAKVGARLTAVPGRWGPAPVTLRYQWFRSGVAIPSATGASYVEGPLDRGKVLAVRVTGSKTGYGTAVRTSRATAVVAYGTLTGPVPTITGTARLGMRLTANPGTWGPAPVTLRFQWLRAGTAIGGATSQAYLVAAADAGKTISVRVTGTKTAYSTLARTSGTVAAPTDRLAPGAVLRANASLLSTDGRFRAHIPRLPHVEHQHRVTRGRPSSPAGCRQPQSAGA